MPRRPRGKTGGYLFHVLNRAVGRATIFERPSDYAAFERVLQEARDWVPTMRLLDFCVMPNHWHLVVWPRHDLDLSEYLRWLTVTHTSRWHVAHGPPVQARFIRVGSSLFRFKKTNTFSLFVATWSETYCERI